MKPSDYNFDIGDKVVTTYGEVGKIVDICTCESCEKRGFYEPMWVEDGFDDPRYITCWEAETGFGEYYQIGKYRFNHVFNKLIITLDIKKHEDLLARRKKQLAVMEKLEKEADMCGKLNDYDFSCWAIRYDISHNGELTYKEGCLKVCDGRRVPLLWQHNHNHDRDYNILGHALLEHRKDGVFVYGKFLDTEPGRVGKELVAKENGTLSISPYIANVQQDKNVIVFGMIKEVSLVFERIDPDRAYYPVLKECD